MDTQHFEARTFSSYTQSTAGSAGELHSETLKLRFQVLFGVSPDFCSMIWFKSCVKKTEELRPHSSVIKSNDLEGLQYRRCAIKYCRCGAKNVSEIVLDARSSYIKSKSSPFNRIIAFHLQTSD